MKGLERFLQRRGFRQDKFQTFVCYLLLFLSIFTTIPPIAVIITSQEVGACEDSAFVVYAHYSLHKWITAKFQEFVSDINVEGNQEFAKICYELFIEDSALPFHEMNIGPNQGRLPVPTIWIPETYLWIDLAEEILDTKLVKNKSRDCHRLTQIPFGIITWKRMADFLAPNGETVSFTTIQELAQADFETFTNDLNETVADYYHDVGRAPKAFFFGHGNPNVTSGGLLGFNVMFSSLQGVGSGNVFAFDDEDDMCTNDDTATYTETIAQVMGLEDKVVASSNIDYTFAETMLSRGPEYLHMAFGFEHEVADFNDGYSERMAYLWNDTLAFLYLDTTYWIEHPMCKLTAHESYDSKHDEVTTAFITWLNQENRIADLQNYGLRPYGAKINASTNIITPENGCNLDIEPDQVYATPTVETARCMQVKYQQLKKKLRLTILLDASSNLLKDIGDSKTRWSGIVESLYILPEILADSTQLSLSCFQRALKHGCGINTFPQGGTLAEDRATFKTIMSEQIATRPEEDIWLFWALNATYADVESRKEQDPGWRDVILVVSEDDNHDDRWQQADALIEDIGVKYGTPTEEIHVWSILYYGDTEGITASTLKSLADRTNGQYATSTADSLKQQLIEFAYSW
eukprot:CAMPEP_0202687118 /NCGR_PEP_ID=MMETSP1385-20130828/2819_1 /ASSEMBLY_ACC=CAM_ASM_000861 /TAXON_ID=933848 /ORGANISM="Elphidium margaritaceum" /LENGTH=632 /DNA_ID=CAMNT_0049341843 /DNA_START=49 /DNA_END=1947 /DNA_ORIENTATION=+